MRIYVPVTLDELDTAETSARGARWNLSARSAHAVTLALRAALADEDDEGCEYAAFLAAADDSLGLVAAGEAAPPVRAVVSLDVPDGAVAARAPSSDAAQAPSTVTVAAADGVAIVAVHVDEPEAAADVRAVLTAADGDDDEALAAAVQRVTDRDLLWYDPSEVHQIPRP